MNSKNNKRRSFTNGRKNASRKDARSSKYRDDKSRDSRSYGEDQVKEKRGYTNAPAWYADELMGHQVANLAYANLAGVPLPVGIGNLTTDNATKASFSTNYAKVASVCTIDYQPVYGRSKTLTSSVNVAAQQVYKFVRHENSGASNYEMQDLYMYVMAMDQIYLAISEAKRMLSAVYTFSQENWDFPSVIARACGLSDGGIKDAIKNAAQYRAWLNSIIVRVNKLAVPGDFNLLLRRNYISSRIFADSTSMRGQFYVFRAISYGSFNSTASSSGSSVTYSDPSTVEGMRRLQGTSFNQVLQQLENMLAAVMNEEDIGIMSGDILKAYKDRIIKIELFEDNTPLTIDFSEEILNQIENSFTLGFEGTTTSGGPYCYLPVTSITQSVTEGIRCVPMWSSKYAKWNNGATQTTGTARGWNSPWIFTKYVLNSHKDEPDWKDNIENTRLFSVPCTNYIRNGNDYLLSTEIDCGSECVTGFCIYRDATVVNPGVCCSLYLPQGAGSQKTSEIELEVFDWHPIIYKGDTNADGTTLTYYVSGVMADLKKYTLIDLSTLQSINNVAMLGLLLF